MNAAISMPADNRRPEDFEAFLNLVAGHYRLPDEDPGTGAFQASIRGVFGVLVMWAKGSICRGGEEVTQEAGDWHRPWPE